MLRMPFVANGQNKTFVANGQNKTYSTADSDWFLQNLQILSNLHEKRAVMNVWQSEWVNFFLLWHRIVQVMQERGKGERVREREQSISSPPPFLKSHSSSPGGRTVPPVAGKVGKYLNYWRLRKKTKKHITNVKTLYYIVLNSFSNKYVIIASNV